MEDLELKTALRYNSTLVVSVLVLCAIIAAVAYFGVSEFLQPKGRISCADFGAYSDALIAYKNGATWLDRNHDGIPCEALYKHDHD